MFTFFQTIIKYFLVLGSSLILTFSGHSTHSVTTKTHILNTTISPSEVQTKPTSMPTIQPQYSITILSAPNLNSNYQILASIKNIYVTPFITNLGFYKCQFTDDRSNSYNGWINAEIKFEKALLPGQSINANLKIMSGVIYGVGDIDPNMGQSNFQKCGYDGKGNNACTPISGIKIESCDAYITTNGTEAGNSFGKMPIKVNFF